MKTPIALSQRGQLVKSILFAAVLIAHITVPSEVAGQAFEAAQSFSRYFSPQVLRAVDAMMKNQHACQSQPDDYWKIWTYGFRKTYRGADGEKKFEVTLNWDGYYYIKDIIFMSGKGIVATGDWTILK